MKLKVTNLGIVLTNSATKNQNLYFLNIFSIIIDRTMDLNKISNSIESISDPFDTKNRKPFFSLFGFSEFSVLDFYLGFASGVFGTNVRDEWH